MAVARILAVESGGVLALWHRGQVHRMPAVEGDWRPGDLVRWGGDELCLLQRPVDGLRHSHPNSEVARLSHDGGRRYRALCERAAILRAIRGYFDAEGFIEMEPPAIATSPGLELHLDAVQVKLRQGMGGSAVERWLVTSPEFHLKRLLVGGFERIYALGRAFRSGERGPWHNPEFTMLEWYRAGARYPAIVADAEAMLRKVWRALEPSLAPERRQVLAPVAAAIGRPFEVHAFRDLLRQAGAGDIDERDSDALITAFVERVEPDLPRDRAVVIDRWPIALASLARPFDGEPGTAERFEIYVGGVELANGFSELVDPDQQRQRFVADLAARARTGRPSYPIDEAFLTALGEGCPPAAGVALGVDRLVMLLGGYDRIDDVIAFPFERA